MLQHVLLVLANGLQMLTACKYFTSRDSEKKAKLLQLPIINRKMRFSSMCSVAGAWPASPRPCIVVYAVLSAGFPLISFLHPLPFWARGGTCPFPSLSLLTGKPSTSGKCSHQGKDGSYLVHSALLATSCHKMCDTSVFDSSGCVSNLVWWMKLKVITGELMLCNAWKQLENLTKSNTVVGNDINWSWSDISLDLKPSNENWAFRLRWREKEMVQRLKHAQHY